VTKNMVLLLKFDVLPIRSPQTLRKGTRTRRIDGGCAIYAFPWVHSPKWDTRCIWRIDSATWNQTTMLPLRKPSAASRHRSMGSLRACDQRLEALWMG